MTEQQVRIERRYAEWMEDAIRVTIPDGATVTDDELHDQVEQLYCGAYNGIPVEIETSAGTVAVAVAMEWENEHRAGVDSIDDEWTIAARWTEPPPDPWDEVDGHPLDDWRYEVANNDTRLGYAEWVQHRRDSERN